jgi:AbrB family looped-hinge helix DNA binding protein
LTRVLEIHTISYTEFQEFRMSEGSFERIVVNERGTVTLPAKVRKHLGLKAGDVLHMEERDGQIILQPTVTVPVRWYTDEEIKRWTEQDKMTPDQERRFNAWKMKAGL